MKIYLHIGFEFCGANQIQAYLDNWRKKLSNKGYLFPKSPGGKNHTRLFMAMTDPDRPEQLRRARGFVHPDRQAGLLNRMTRELKEELQKGEPEVLIFSASQLATGLSQRSELERLKEFLNQFSDDITVVCNIDEQARAWVGYLPSSILMGRETGFNRELKLANRPDWRRACSKHKGPDVDAPPFWLDYLALEQEWAAVFGAKALRFFGYDSAHLSPEDCEKIVADMFDLPKNFGSFAKPDKSIPYSAETLTRIRVLNQVLRELDEKGFDVPRPKRREFMREISVEGPALDAGSFYPISERFADGNQELLKRYKGLSKKTFQPEPKQELFKEMLPALGISAAWYEAEFQPRLEMKPPEKPKRKISYSPDADRLMTPLAKANFEKLDGGQFAPHNRLGTVNEEELAAAYSPIKKRKLKGKNSGNVIVGCMKNEAPYILEWIAYHRAIGVDNFLIYTNGCEDNTDAILGRLQELGVAELRSNENWKGNSPQQHALNQSLKEPLIKNAEWIAHIDVDEFINVRCGNGTLQDFFERVPKATNVAMTWRLFGHNGVTKFEDKLVIEQFDTCAPKYCPKPHTVWGFKTMFKNIGAYAKISCHRPTKLDEDRRGDVTWVNGSGKRLGSALKDNGWRSSVKSVGYDLIQLNHYALRSAESFLIKRQRGRALHVDRSIGMNYWVRMDWTDHRDITIKRNIPRVEAELAMLLGDEILAKEHEKAVAWHRAKADELHQKPEFEELYTQALATRLTEMERVAYALALDTES